MKRLTKRIKLPGSSSTFICITGWGAAQPEEYCGVYNALHKTDMYTMGYYLVTTFNGNNNNNYNQVM